MLLEAGDLGLAASRKSRPMAGGDGPELGFTTLLEVVAKFSGEVAPPFPVLLVFG